LSDAKDSLRRRAARTVLDALFRHLVTRLAPLLFAGRLHPRRTSWSRTVRPRMSVFHRMRTDVAVSVRNTFCNSRSTPELKTSCSRPSA
jgi:hypothetical protein